MKVLLTIVLATMLATTTNAQIKAKDWNSQIKAG